MNPLDDIRALLAEVTAEAGLLLPAPAVSLLLFLGVILLALLLHHLALVAARRTPLFQKPTVSAVLDRVRGLTRLAAVLVAAVIVLPVLEFGEVSLGYLRHGLSILLIALVGWTVIAIITLMSDLRARRYRIDVEDNLTARKFLTQIRVLQRTAVVFVGVITLAVILMTFESVQEYGAGLFASAGVVGLVLGIAARPVLANLIAGIQIAVTQPIRIEDAVVVEGEWGWIEEIASTYVVVRIWDWRRLIVPLSYFIEKPFQNWTRESGSIIGSVFWHADYRVPIAAFREKMKEVVAASAYWDGQVVALQVTEANGQTVELRGLMSARTSPRAWDLRCEVREKMIIWLQENHPQALPRIRAEVAEDRDEALPSDGQTSEPDRLRQPRDIHE
ncbi:mechanosensitive ion channel family protein [Pelagibius sp. 7325]|uniref:mechanosensitive ion channel family protein n=1 Tax=Pelagibius sp. 7325 TaxID=3131994 RepID=UPI0030ECE163